VLSALAACSKIVAAVARVHAVDSFALLWAHRGAVLLVDVTKGAVDCLRRNPVHEHLVVEVLSDCEMLVWHWLFYLRLEGCALTTPFINGFLALFLLFPHLSHSLLVVTRVVV